MFVETKEASAGTKIKKLHKLHCKELLKHNKKSKLPALKLFAKQVIESDMGGEGVAAEWLKNKSGGCDKTRTKAYPPPGGGFCGKPKKKGYSKPKAKRFMPRRSHKKSNWYSKGSE